MFIVFQFVSESIVRMGHGISPSPCVDRTNLYKCLGLLRARGSWPLLSSRRASRSEGRMRFLRRRMHMCQSQWGLRILQFLVVTCVMVSGWQIPRLSHLMISVVMMVMMRFLKLYLNMVMIGMTLKWWKMIASNVFLYIAHMYFAMCCDCVKCHWTWWHFCWTHVMLHQHGAKLSLP